MFGKIKQMFSKQSRDDQLAAKLDELRHKTPTPVFWLFGKTQSGKTSIIKFLTGAEDAEIGQGFQPCTKFSREYQFPTRDAPLMTFVDTRGVDEAGYDPREDLNRFNNQAHVIIVTVKALDHALGNIVNHLRTIRQSRPGRPVVLALTCLHEAYPQQQHPAEIPGPSPLPIDPAAPDPYAKLHRSLDEQRARFEGLVDYVVPLDLTPPVEGFNDPNFGGPFLKETLLRALPAGYRQTLLTLDEATHELQDLYAAHALPHIIGYASMAASAGAIPLPFVDLVLIPGIQTRMIYHLAQLYGQPLTGQRFLELSGTLGLGIVVRQAARGMAKFIPFVGSVAGATFAGAATVALGKAFCYYYSAVHKGHAPNPEDLRRYYQDQLSLAEMTWKKAKQD